MEQWAIELSKLFKERDNKALPEITQAKVINPLPDILVSLGDEIILDGEHLIIANRMFEIELNSGDQVILIPTSNGQLFYLMDKVGQ